MPDTPPFKESCRLSGILAGMYDKLKGQEETPWIPHREAVSAEDALEVMRDALGKHVLDPDFEKYGNFVMLTELPAQVQGTFTQIWGNFYDVSAGFDIRTRNVAVIKELMALIRQHQQSESYAQARESRRIAQEKRAARPANLLP
jgi:hypothetical protein